MSSDTDVSRGEKLVRAGIVGVSIGWADTSGIVRARTVPVSGLDDAVRRGIGVTAMLVVFDGHDTITFEHEALSEPVGDLRLVPVIERLTPLAGQPGFAWAPGRLHDVDGEPSPYDPRGALERQVARAARLGLEMRAGFELEMVVGRGRDDGALVPAHDGPAYSAQAMLAVDRFVAQVLVDLQANGMGVGQIHAEFGAGQMEMSLEASDPVTAADQQVLARQTVHAAARAHGLRVSFAPLVREGLVGNGMHVHTSLWRDGRNLLAGDGPHGLSADGAAYIAGLLRELPAVVALTAPSTLSLARLRPGFWSSAYRFWGVQNREAPLRYIPTSPLLGPSHANVEVKAGDASANPYLALAAILAAGMHGVQDGLELEDPIQADPSRWEDSDRARRRLALLPATAEDRERALRGSDIVAEALGEPLLGAVVAVRRSDARWAHEHSLEELIADQLWRY
jgi:glutamine synthetase